MALDSGKPLRLINIERRVEEMFSELIDEPWGRTAPAVLPPLAVDVYETADAYLIEADLPGVLPDAVQLEVADRRVALRATRRTLHREEVGRTIRIERAQGEFVRVLEFEIPIDVQAVEKQFEHGLLRVRLPKLKQR